MSKESGSCLTTQHQKYRVCLYIKTTIPFALIVYELIVNSAIRASLAMSSYTTRAHSITVYCLIYINYYSNKPIINVLGLYFKSFFSLLHRGRRLVLTQNAIRGITERQIQCAE